MSEMFNIFCMDQPNKLNGLSYVLQVVCYVSFSFRGLEIIMRTQLQ